MGTFPKKVYVSTKSIFISTYFRSEKSIGLFGFTIDYKTSVELAGQNGEKLWFVRFDWF